MTIQIECIRCGRCCLADLIAYVSEDDRKRWNDEGRLDILKIVENEKGVWAGDRLVSAETGKSLHGCPFYCFDGNNFGCSIYETRPGICRNYQPAASEICSQFNRKLRK